MTRILFPMFIAAMLTAEIAAAELQWHHPLYLDGGRWWNQRISVSVANESESDLAGFPVEIAAGSEAGQANLVGQPVESLRVCDADGTEMLFAVSSPSGQELFSGTVESGSALVLPVECKAGSATAYYIYFDNPAAGHVPEQLPMRARLLNGDLEQGDDAVPVGWIHDGGDQQHRALWSDETPKSGAKCLKTVVAEGADPTWISTRQQSIAVLPGARYRFTAWVRAQNVHGLAGWYLHVGNAEQPMIDAPMLSGGDGSYPWKMVRHEFTVPPHADRLSLGTVLRGTGTAWFDLVTLEQLSTGKLRIELGSPERLDLREIAADGDWMKDSADGPPLSLRARIPVINTQPRAIDRAMVAVDLWRLEARLRGRLDRESLLFATDGRVVPYRFFGDQLLAEVGVPERSCVWCDVYCSTESDNGSPPDPVSSVPLPLADSPANLVRNPGFEQGDSLPLHWMTSPGQAQHGVTFDCDLSTSVRFGQRAARMHVPAGAPSEWRGWHQDIAVCPGQCYLLAAWVKCDGITAGDVRLHAHRRTADGQMSRQQPYASVGPAISGTTDWTLMSGVLRMGADTERLHLHLTTEHAGTVWHDQVALVEIVQGEISRLETVPVPDREAPLLWQVPAVVKVFQDDPPPREIGPLQIDAARNEREPLQLAIHSDHPLSDVRVTVEPPIGPDGRRLEDLQVQVVGYVPIDRGSNYYRSDAPDWHRRIPLSRSRGDGWPGLWPDPLLPTDTFDLAARSTQPIWVTVYVPKTAPAGVYRSKISLTRGGRVLHAVPFTVRVWDFELPDENHVAAIYDVRLGPGGSLWGKSLDELYPDIIRFMADRRLCPDTIRPAPVFRLEEGEIQADFTAFDRAAEVYFDQLKFPFAYTPWQLYLFGWGHPSKTILGQRPYESETPFEDPDQLELRTEYKRTYQAMLRLFWNHVRAKGWDQRIVLYISDEPFDQQSHIRQQMKALCDMIHEVDPEIPIYSSTWHHVPDWDGYLDIWGIGHDGRVAPEKMAQLRAAGDRIWFTTDGQMCTDTPYCAVERLLPHYCFHNGAEAYEFWGLAWLTYDPYRFGWHSFIHQSSEPGRSYWVRYPNGDGFLLYPGAPFGHDGLISSIRLEQAREGVEDYEYLHLLELAIQRVKASGGDTRAAEATLNDAAALVEIPNAGGYFSTKILPDPRRLYAVRQRLAQAIEAIGAN